MQGDTGEGFLCDPPTKSSLRILARPGIVLRRSRSLGNQRGCVNGAWAVVDEPLRPDAVCIAKLQNSGNDLLIHPMDEESVRVVPCCDGYATTVRRA